MIIEGLLDLVFWFIELLFSSFQLISLPTGLLGGLLDFIRVGAWVVGSDILGLAFGTIIFWFTFKLSAGLILFIWRLIPLT